MQYDKAHNIADLRKYARLRVPSPMFNYMDSAADDEVTLIIFTSLDLDWLNNLIVLAGEFTLWFNINFEGEGRDEIDFRDNKYEIWEATVTLAKVIVAEYDALQANQ